MKLFILAALFMGTLSFGSVLKQIESAHVEHSKITPMLMRRALKIAVEAFDPYKIYLSKEEVYPLVYLSDKRLSDLAAHVRQGDFSGFDPLFSLFAKASIRAQQWRQEMSQDSSPVNIALKEGYVESIAQLKEQQKAYIAACAAHAGLETAPWNELVTYFDKKLSYHERGYNLKQWKMQAIKACAKSFDPHTAYYTADETAQMRAYLEKGFRGIGISFTENLKGLFVSRLTEGAPAAKNGHVSLGDRLIAIEGKSVLEMSFVEAMNHLRRAASPVKLDFEKEDGRYRVSLEKVLLEVQEGRVEIASEPTEGGVIAKLKLHTFYESDKVSAAHDLRSALRKLKAAAPIKGLILDLRENPGGFLSQGIKVAGTFMHSGVVATAHCRDSERQFLRDLSCQKFYSGPLVVLISKASASCSEIVAGALQDYGIAVVVGDERSFGKATIQDQTLTRSSSSSYRVTMGRYYTVSGRSPQIEGVLADIVVPTHYHRSRMGERYLSYPLAPNHAKAAFQDPLSDIHTSRRSALRSRYLPHIQKRDDRWQKVMHELKELSRERLDTSEAYQDFLTDPRLQREDLVMHEATNILKDMIRLSTKAIAKNP